MKEILKKINQSDNLISSNVESAESANFTDPSASIDVISSTSLLFDDSDIKIIKNNEVNDFDDFESTSFNEMSGGSEKLLSSYSNGSYESYTDGNSYDNSDETSLSNLSNKNDFDDDDFCFTGSETKSGNIKYLTPIL